MREDILREWLDSPDTSLLSDASLRLARNSPWLRERLDPIITDPPSRSLAGLQPPEFSGGPSDQLLACLAAMDGGLDIPAPVASSLEEGCHGGPGWVHAARAHVYASPERERSARMSLSVQQLPFASPGILCPVQVELFAAGEFLLQVFHVDWARKLASHALEALDQDCRVLGLWADPLLSYLPERLLPKSLSKLRRSPRLTPDGAGLAAYYAYRCGMDPAPYLRLASPRGTLLFAFGSEGIRSIEDN